MPRAPVSTCAMKFPPLSSPGLSQSAADQGSLKRIKEIWSKHSAKWPVDIQQTIIDNLKHVRWTKSNGKQPSGHRLWKDGELNFGIWVLMVGIYGKERLDTMKKTLQEKFPDINFDLMDGPSPPPAPPAPPAPQVSQVSQVPPTHTASFDQTQVHPAPPAPQVHPAPQVPQVPQVPPTHTASFNQTQVHPAPQVPQVPQGPPTHTAPFDQIPLARKKRRTDTAQGPTTDHQPQDTMYDLAHDYDCSGAESSHGHSQTEDGDAIGHSRAAAPRQVDDVRRGFTIHRVQLMQRVNNPLPPCSVGQARGTSQLAAQQTSAHHQQVHETSSFEASRRLPPTRAQGVDSIEQPTYHHSSMHNQAQVPFVGNTPQSSASSNTSFVYSPNTGAHGLPSQSQALPQQSDSYHHGSHNQSDQSSSPYSMGAYPMNVDTMVNQPEPSTYDPAPSSSPRSQPRQFSPLASQASPQAGQAAFNVADHLPRSQPHRSSPLASQAIPQASQASFNLADSRSRSPAMHLSTTVERTHARQASGHGQSGHTSNDFEPRVISRLRAIFFAKLDAMEGKHLEQIRAMKEEHAAELQKLQQKVTDDLEKAATANRASQNDLEQRIAYLEDLFGVE